MQNSPQYLIGHYAIQVLGATVVPLNPMYKDSELEYFISEAEIKAAISGQELYKQIKSVKDKVSLEFPIITNYADYLTENHSLSVPDELNMQKQKFKNTYDFIE